MNPLGDSVSGSAGRCPASTLPLLAARDLAAPLAWCAGRPVSGHAFLVAAAALAERLPARGRPINLCQDRLLFAIGLAAALQRGQTSLMPPNALPATLRQLPAAGAPPYVLIDAAAGGEGFDAGGLPRRVVPPLLAIGDCGGASADEVPQISAELDAVCLLTSGSTGAPQPHAKRFAPLTLNIGAEAERLALWLERPSLHGLTVVATVPAQHSYGLESSVLLALLGGAAFDAGRPFYPADIAAALAAVPRPRALVTTPFHLKALLQSGVALPPVDLMLSATAPLSPQLAAQAEAAMGGCLGEIYGCTEAGQVAARRTTQGDTWTTLGALRITRAAAGTGDTAGSGADAQYQESYVVHGGHVTEPTPLADLLELHDAQHFRLLGRANDLIHVAGKRSSLAHLNFHLNRVEGVQDGAFWLPEPGDLAPAGAAAAAGAELESVQRPIAFVVAPGLSASRVIGALRAELEPAFVPRRVVQVAALPREATGKLTASALRQFALATLRAPAASVGAGTGDDTDTDTYAIDAKHPAFAGHFPGQPVLPGVVLLSLVMRSVLRRTAWRQRLGERPAIEQVKFLAAVGPGERVRVRLSEHGTGLAFECHADTRLAARGRLGVEPGASAPPRASTGTEPHLGAGSERQA